MKPIIFLSVTLSVVGIAHGMQDKAIMQLQQPEIVTLQKNIKELSQRVDAVEVLVQKLSINTTDNNNAKREESESIETASDVEYNDEDELDEGANILFQVARYGTAVEVLKEILDTKEYDINAGDSKGRTPLLYACAYNSQLDIIKTLVLHGANPDIKDKDGATPWLCAAIENEEVSLTPRARLTAMVEALRERDKQRKEEEK